MSAPAEQPFSALIQRLEQITTLLERGDVPLEEALSLFEEGTALATAATGRLDQAELRVRQVTGEDADGEPVQSDLPD